jgi:enterochelin esterase family protein
MSPIVWSSTPGEAIAAWNPPPSALPLKSVKLKEHVVTDSAGEYSRTVWISTRPSVASSRLYLFLDAEYYLQRMDTLAVMTDLQASGSIPPGICLFVSHRDHAARHDDYTCNPRYAGFIAEDVIRWAQVQEPQISNSGHLICGLSLSGLAAIHLSLARPDLFPRVISQSPSAWWNQEWLRQNLGTPALERTRFWISVGDQERESGISHPPTGMRQEVAQVDSVERLARKLKDQRAAVHYHLFPGGHQTECWKAELCAAMKWATANF